MKRSVNFSHTGPNDRRKRFDYFAQLMRDVGTSEETQKRALIEFKLIELSSGYEFIKAHCPGLFTEIDRLVTYGLTGEQIASRCQRAKPLARARIRACADYLRLKKL